MQTQVESILRQIDQMPLNILTAPTHETFQGNWAKLPHTFYLLQHPSFKPWSFSQRSLPQNHVLLNGSNGQINHGMKFDIVLSQNKFGQYQVLKPIADKLNIPLISLEHTLPVPQWTHKRLQTLAQMRGDINVFITEYSVGQWLFNLTDNDTKVIRHGIDTDVYKSDNSQNYNGKILTVANDYINRQWCLGWDIYERVCLRNKLPVNPVGNTPGFSTPTKSLDELLKHFNTCSVFFNTSTVSPLPMSLLEAASMGCPIVTNATCGIPEIFQDGYNAFVSKDEEYLLDRLRWCLNNPGEARATIGANARKTMISKLSIDAHIVQWNEVFNQTRSIIHG